MRKHTFRIEWMTTSGDTYVGGAVKEDRVITHVNVTQGSNSMQYLAIGVIHDSGCSCLIS